MFIDETTIKARAGDGGRGCISFRREKFEPWGGPNGGDGGKGGDVILRGDDDQNNLIDFKYKPHWNGQRGEHGQGKDCNGREGRAAILRVPLGTLVHDVATGAIVESFQSEALACRRTTLIETRPGHRIRCAPTPFLDDFAARDRQLRRDGHPADERGKALETLLAGRLRLASKGVERTDGALRPVDAQR